MKAFLLVVIVSVCGCSVSPHKAPVLADGMWSEFVYAIGSACALDAMVAGINEAEIERLSNQCLRVQGLTI